MQVKEREYKQQLESLRSQAVFNVRPVVSELIQNHAVMSSVARGRQASQRQSPKTEAKQPAFKSFVNAFGPSRAKRPRTEESSVFNDPHTPEASPSKLGPGTSQQSRSRPESPLAEETAPDLKAEVRIIRGISL
jgi:hypothetical protein